ncbi:hypothetical protein LOC68_00050 [Blastopirellula sp. JC732]|uniref:Uncharacterized protein n=1 Tax=Blastopirellula sediminis TaxID=2894196 RepID=A0A9X1SEN1_9BACT|nr:hypothetical protein [Blastopirellula sediminis]MCC9604266.1 hypothetical protein [Blastopirellula sediminis]MCC9626786.1 hypothetical protein [Blastopirellula sediminis]
MSKMLDALKRLQEQGAAPASTPTINNTVGQIDAVRDVAAAVGQAIAETEERLRSEYERQIAERDQQLALQRQHLEAELSAEKTELERQLSQLQSQLESHQSDASAHEELQTELQAEIARLQAAAEQLRQEDAARFRQEQESLQKRLHELDATRQKVAADAATLTERLQAKEAELHEIQQAIQSTSSVDEEALRASLSAELSKQAEEFARKEADLHNALAEARRMVENQQNDLAEIIRLRTEEKARFEKSRAAAVAQAQAQALAQAQAQAVEPPGDRQAESLAEPQKPPVAKPEPPSLLLRSFTSAAPRPHLCSFEEQTLADMQDARISERYERLAQPSTKPTSSLFLSADGGDDAHQAGFHTAVAAAREDRRVLIIDGDVHGKQLSHRLRMRDSLGFYEVIRRETKWTERVVGLRCGQIDFLPAGRSLYTVSRSDLESAQAVWRELNEIWPLIILVGEHPGAVSTELYCVLCQSIYLTACLGRATKDDVKAASKRIASIGGRIEAAVAMNAKLK